jgi:intracellular sulfur oxidation DsrE/DsrF family protein
VPLYNAKDANLAFSVAHIEKILQQSHVQPGNIALVAIGKGIELFQVDNIYQERLQNLLAKGVQMYVCEASMKSVNKAQRQPVMLTDGVHKVPNGKQYIDELMEQGYINSFA